MEAHSSGGVLMSGVLASTTLKRDVVSLAFDELGLSGLEYDNSGDFPLALRRLDALMSEWSRSGLAVGYNQPVQFGTSNLNDPSGLPDDTVNVAAMALAQRLAPTIGKSLSAESRISLTQSMIQLRTIYSNIPERQYAAGTPRGAGNKPWSTWSPYYRSGDCWQSVTPSVSISAPVLNPSTLVNAKDDAGAAALGVAAGGYYRNDNVVQVRTGSLLVNASGDASAVALGVPYGGLYRNNDVVQVVGGGGYVQAANDGVAISQGLRLFALYVNGNVLHVVITE